jgi:hypothetical protein
MSGSVHEFEDVTTAMTCRRKMIDRYNISKLGWPINKHELKPWGKNHKRNLSRNLTNNNVIHRDLKGLNKKFFDSRQPEEQKDEAVNKVKKPANKPTSIQVTKTGA